MARTWVELVGSVDSTCSEGPSEWVLLPDWMLKDLGPVSGLYHRDLPQFSDATLPVGCAAGIIRVGCQDLPCGLGPNCG